MIRFWTSAAFVNARGERVLAQPKDVAILFRKLTDIHDYFEPLRRQGIRYVVEGERHFYAAKEIIDAVNLLRAIENPNDRLALVGVLRSPIRWLERSEASTICTATICSTTALSEQLSWQEISHRRSPNYIAR